MKIEIWSDIMCPFCYIGKRRFEKALKEFGNKEAIEIEWKSYQLNPHLKTEADKNINQYLAEIKGWSLDEAKAMNDRVTRMAAAEGLIYNMDQAVVANSFDAHRLIQFAKTRGKGDAMEEELFLSYFTHGKNIADHKVLTELAEKVGLDKIEAGQILSNDSYSMEVNSDIVKAHRIGVSGVPFFVFNRRNAVSGAQDPETFLDVLNKTLNENK